MGINFNTSKHDAWRPDPYLQMQHLYLGDNHLEYILCGVQCQLLFGISQSLDCFPQLSDVTHFGGLHRLIFLHNALVNFPFWPCSITADQALPQTADVTLFILQVISSMVGIYIM